MVTKNFQGSVIISPGGDRYYPNTGQRDWVRHKKPYSAKVGPFVSYRTIKRDVVCQDSYWNPASNSGKVWLLSGSAKAPLPDPRTDSFSSTIRNKCVYKLQDDIAKSDFNLAVSGAEASKTVQLITSTASRLYMAARALKKGRLGDAYRVLGLEPGKRRLPKPKAVRNNAAGYWLELQYGWGPLLADIDGACSALATRLNEPQVPVFYSEARSGERSFRNVVTYSGRSTWEAVIPWDVVSREVCRMGVYYRIRNGNIMQAARLGITNPALVIWELVPFSFVVDWFIPVGNFLSQLSAYHGLEFVTGYQTQFYKHSALSGPNKAVGGLRIYGSAVQTVTRQRRTKLTSFPYAYPIIKDPFSVNHAVTTLALLTTVLGGFKSRTARL